MNGKRYLSITGIAVLVLVAILVGLMLKGPPANPGTPVGTQAGSTDNHASTSENPSVAMLEQRLQSAATALASAATVDAKAEALARLRGALAGDTNEVSAAIRRLLDSNIDAATGLGFKIAGNGGLTETPTLRTFLLDQLAKFDPAAAAAYAREILNTSSSPDEWAIALRNLARGDTSPDGRALLQTKSGELLRNTAWQQDPSVGYLEAFDTAVHLGGTNLLPPLSELMRKKDNRAVAHAAFLTLDRLIQAEPAVVLQQLQSRPAAMEGREGTRADFFARADVRDPQQRAILEDYLLDPSRSAAEIHKFAGTYPNANYMISYNLLTKTVTPTGAELTARDRQSFQVVADWLIDPRFARLVPELQTIKSRLEQFVKSPGRSQP